jgi:hypothetical protein
MLLVIMKVARETACRARKGGVYLAAVATKRWEREVIEELISLKDQGKFSVARANFEFVERCDSGFDTMLFPHDKGS